MGSPMPSDETYSQRGKRNRDAGKRFEREVATLLRKVTGSDHVRRGWQSRVGHDEPDVTGIDRVWVECKAVQTFSFLRVLKKAVEDVDKSAKDYEYILIFVKHVRPGTRKYRRQLFVIGPPFSLSNVLCDTQCVDTVPPLSTKKYTDIDDTVFEVGGEWVAVFDFDNGQVDTVLGNIFTEVASGIECN